MRRDRQQAARLSYAAGRTQHWLKVKNPDAPAVRREREEHWGG
jgi:hypothetical protein